MRRAEHLGAGDEIGAPHAAEALVEALRISAWILLPVAIEALGPGIQREGVVAAQVLDVDDLEPAVLHRGDGLRQARDPAAGKDVLADVELGVAHADVTDEMQHAEPAGLEEIGVRLHHFAQLVATGVLEHADRDDLVELGVHLAEIGFAHLELVAADRGWRSARAANRLARWWC